MQQSELPSILIKTMTACAWENGLILAFLMAILIQSLDGLMPMAIKEIIKNHNTYRANVLPQAADMLNMSWYEPASNTAQKWASQCQRLMHDDKSQRKDVKYGSCGQNIFISSSAKATWQTAIKAWHSEVSKFNYGSANNVFQEIGHYTQVVWAKTHKVGCGFARCEDSKGIYFNYICNYCPAGNMKGQINTPYKKGLKCSACPDSCLKNTLCASKK